LREEATALRWPDVCLHRQRHVSKTRLFAREQLSSSWRRWMAAAKLKHDLIHKLRISIRRNCNGVVTARPKNAIVIWLLAGQHD
jgi:hypothetical protein